MGRSLGFGWNHYKIEGAKEGLLKLMKNISTVSDQSAAAVSEASVSIDGQLGMVVQMNQEAQELGKTAEKLVEAISIFKI